MNKVSDIKEQLRAIALGSSALIPAARSAIFFDPIIEQIK
jgi:hypothetical protein